jgi:hypothetical protein
MQLLTSFRNPICNAQTLHAQKNNEAGLDSVLIETTCTWPCLAQRKVSLRGT